MIQQHPYCRTCGSMVKSKSICHYCGCEPLKGHNYCCDCGTSTISEAVMCVHCGASFQRKFPATLVVLISIALAVSLGGAAYFIAQQENGSSEKMAETSNTEPRNDSVNIEKSLPLKKNESGETIINNPGNLLKPKNDAISRLVKNLPDIPEPEADVNNKPVIPEKIKEETITPREKPISTPGRISMNVFSSREMRNYSVGCTYFTGRSKNNVVFFTTNVYGYVKINGKVYVLQGVQKGNDIARFSGAGYDVSIEILGLAGNENEWMAEATLIVKDIRQRTLSTHKVYSACTDF